MRLDTPLGSDKDIVKMKIKVNAIFRDIDGHFISSNMASRQCIRFDDRNCQRKCYF